MFIGHFAVALAAKRAAPKTSLGTLLLSAQFADLLWPFFVLLGLERVRIDPGNTAVTPLAFDSYPYTHSLVADAGWAIAFAIIYYSFRRYWRGAWILALGVLSHWVLDAISHRPDVPVFLNGPYVGLGLWNSRVATLIIELGLFAAGAALYQRTTKPVDGVGRWAYAGFCAVAVTVYLLHFFGPPPPSVKVLAITGLGLWLYVGWAYWADAHRTVLEAGASGGASNPGG